MLLSFSVDYMRPYVEAGYRQYLGFTVTERVKRQTIRQRGPRANVLLGRADPSLSLHLWWKSRTKDRAFIGRIDCGIVEPIRIANQSGALLIECDDMARLARESFALADGFESLTAFRDYFVPNMGDVFNGILYKW